jgi:SAM-dependent methyltransferase
MFAMAIHGLAPLLGEEIAELDGAVVRDQGFDGRADVVLFDLPPAYLEPARSAEPERAARPERAGRGGRAVRPVRVRPSARLRLGLAEDVFVEVGRTLRADGDDPRWIAKRLWGQTRIQRALAAWSALTGGDSHDPGYRVVVRVLQERSFLRSELRREVTRTIKGSHPRWRVQDPATLEIWVSEYRPGQFVAGLRVSDLRLRQHGGRTAERPGALRPTLAAAMVRQAGPPPGSPPGLLLDPCCGSGTVLAEGIAAGWTVYGSDVDAGAVKIAKRNVPKAHIGVGDVHHIDREDGSVDACVSNLPFGQQFEVTGDMGSWLGAALGEMNRVTRPGGRVVVLAPDVPRSAVPGELRQTRSYRFRLLGTWTRLYCYDKKPAAGGRDG